MLPFSSFIRCDQIQASYLCGPPRPLNWVSPWFFDGMGLLVPFIFLPVPRPSPEWDVFFLPSPLCSDSTSVPKILLYFPPSVLMYTPFLWYIRPIHILLRINLCFSPLRFFFMPVSVHLLTFSLPSANCPNFIHQSIPLLVPPKKDCTSPPLIRLSCLIHRVFS